MKKLWISFLLAAVLLAAVLLRILPAPAAQADGTVRVSLPGHSVTVNGQTVSSEHSRYPFLVYKDITYFPMTYYDCRLLGLSTAWTKEDGLTVEKNDASLSEYVREVQSVKNERVQQARIAEGPVTVNGKSIDNSSEPYPVLSFRDVAYFPLTWRFAVEEFGWDYEFDDAAGLTVSDPKSAFIPGEEWDGGIDTYGGLMGTGDMKLAGMFHMSGHWGGISPGDHLTNIAEEDIRSSFYLYNVTGEDIRLLEDGFQWEYQIYRVIGKREELVYRKAIPLYSGEIPESHWMYMDTSDSYWKTDVPPGEYRCGLLHPENYTYQILGDEQILTEPTEGNGYAVCFSTSFTVE